MRKSYRVKSEKDFQQVFESGDSVANRAFVIYVVEKPENKHFRVGISVGKKVGHTAVARNRLKRYIRAVIDEEKLQKQVQLMEERLLNVSYTDWQMVYVDGHKDPIQGVNWSLARILSLWGIFGTLPPHCFLYRRDFLEKNNITIPTQVKEREDWDFHIEVFSTKPKIERIKGYCGAFYTKSPNGKTTGASFDKIHFGTLKYLLYKIQHVRGYQKCLLYLRISLEYYLIIFHNLTRRKSNKKVHSLFSKAKGVLMISLLYTPISFIIILYNYICSKLSI